MIARNQKRKSFQTVLADLFMNFSLALVWLLYLMPQQQEVQNLPDNLPPPTEKIDGDRPGAGQNILKITFSPMNQALIEYGDSVYQLKDAPQLFELADESAPDVLVLSMRKNEEWTRFLNAAVEHDLPVTIEFQE